MGGDTSQTDPSRNKGESDTDDPCKPSKEVEKAMRQIQEVQRRRKER